MALAPHEPVAGLGPGNHPYNGDNYPDRAFPVIYADSVYSIGYGNGHVKFYIARLDPSIKGDGSSYFNPFAQIVMPELAFVTTALFFEQQLNIMVKSNRVSQAEVDRIRSSFSSQ